MPPLQSERKKCYIATCAYDRKQFGLCGTHSKQYRDDGLWRHEVACYEIEVLYQPPPMGFYSYKRRLQTLAKTLPVSKKEKRNFVGVMLKKFWGSEING